MLLRHRSLDLHLDYTVDNCCLKSQEIEVVS